MKKIVIPVFLSLVNFYSYSQTLQFNDTELKNYLLNENCVDLDSNGIGNITADLNNDNEIQVSEASSITSLDITTNSYNITSISDLSQFQNLEKLVIVANISSVTLNSQSLQDIRINDCGVHYIDVSNVPNLKEIRFESLWLKYLNLKNGSAASYLSLFYSNVDSLICVDSIQLEYNQVLTYVFDSTKITYNCIATHTNSINNLSHSELKLYPNPVSSYLQFKPNKNIQISTYKIFNNIGQEIDSGKIGLYRVNTKDLKSGLYIIKLVTNKGVLTKRFLKN